MGTEWFGRVGAMKAFPRLIAGTAVALAAVLTAAPLGAGLADFVLSPDHHTKRSTAPTAAAESPQEQGEPWGGGLLGSAERGEGLERPEPLALAPRTADAAVTAATSPNLTLAAGTGGESVEARITELAADLQAGVRAGEFTQADADRVLGDMAGYIRGERTWPERVSV